MYLEADMVMELTVEIGEVLDVGVTPRGYLRLIPITGGTFLGEKIKGRIIPGGYDWNTTINDSLAHVLAKYAIQTDDGVYISVENEGYLDIKESNSVIKTTPRFQVADGKYEWLRNGVYAGCLEVPENAKSTVNIKVYRMK